VSAERHVKGDDDDDKELIGPEVSLTAGANARQIGGDCLFSFLSSVVALASLIVAQVVFRVACVFTSSSAAQRTKKGRYRRAFECRAY
jgi:hypothetical protein